MQDVQVAEEGVKVLLSYHPVWLQLGLEAVTGLSMACAPGERVNTLMCILSLYVCLIASSSMRMQGAHMICVVPWLPPLQTLHALILSYWCMQALLARTHSGPSCAHPFSMTRS